MAAKAVSLAKSLKVSFTKGKTHSALNDWVTKVRYRAARAAKKNDKYTKQKIQAQFD